MMVFRSTGVETHRGRHALLVVVGSLLGLFLTQFRPILGLASGAVAAVVAVVLFRVTRSALWTAWVAMGVALGVVLYYLLALVNMANPTPGSGSGIAGQVRVSSDGFAPAGPTSSYSGTVQLRDNGCIFLDLGDRAVWMVWPPGASYESTGERQSNIRLADNTRVLPGDRIDVVGELITRSGLPQGDNADSQWGSQARFCLAPTKQDAEILRAVSVAHG